MSACKKCYGSNPPSSSSSTSSTSKKKTTSITLNHSSEVLVVGKSLKLKVKGSSSKVNWSSSNKKVAQVSKKGKVTAKKKGKAVITAEVGQKKLKCNIKVEEPILSETSVTLYEDETADIRLKGCSHDVEWESMDEDVAEVEDGEIYAWTAGTTTVTAYVHGKTYKCKVVVLEDGDLDEEEDTDYNGYNETDDLDQ